VTPPPALFHDYLLVLRGAERTFAATWQCGHNWQAQPAAWPPAGRGGVSPEGPVVECSSAHADMAESSLTASSPRLPAGCPEVCASLIPYPALSVVAGPTRLLVPSGGDAVDPEAGSSRPNATCSDPPSSRALVTTKRDSIAGSAITRR